MNKCYYEILQVQKNATYREIKKSYRKLVIKYHPDRNGDTAFYNEKIKEINLAYECLSDARKRAAYDDGVYDKKDNFSQAHKSTSSRDPFATGFRDNVYNVEINLEEAFYGCKKRLTVLDNYGLDYFYTVEIPQGVDNGNMLVVAGNERVSEFYIKTQISAHSFYTRRGTELYCTVTIPYIKILTGGNVEIPWFDGSRMFEIQRTAYSGMVVTIPNMGMPLIGHSDRRGSLHIEINVKGTVDFSSVLQKEFAAH